MPAPNPTVLPGDYAPAGRFAAISRSRDRIRLIRARPHPVASIRKPLAMNPPSLPHPTAPKSNA